MENKYLLSTLVKANKIIELVKNNKSITLKQVQDELNLSKPTAFRMLYSLTDLGWLVKQEKQYYLKSQEDNKNMFELNWKIDLLIKKLVDEIKLSAYIGMISNNEIVITQVIAAENHPQDYQRLGESLPINTTAMGKCALAFLDSIQRENLLKLPIFSKKTKYTLADGIILKQNLQVIRENGYAVDDEEKEMDFRCVAVPLRKSKDEIAVLGISGSLAELKHKNIKSLAKMMKKLSKQIEIEMS